MEVRSSSLCVVTTTNLSEVLLSWVRNTFKSDTEEGGKEIKGRKNVVKYKSKRYFLLNFNGPFP
jgi:hypothetical protein